MDRFTADRTGLSFFVARFVKVLSTLSIVIINLQLTVKTDGSLAELLHGYHHHLQHHPQAHPSQVRWTKPPERTSHQGRPVDVMTDVINDLGFMILDRYVENVGNIGFSPSGLGFVLAALYEGSAGTSSRQIAEVLRLPDDRRVTRIGLRDIHRRLRSYLNADAFLGGLTLNRDDINLRPEYEDILRFYGFNISDSDVDVEPITILPNATNSSSETSATTESTTQLPTESSTELPTESTTPTPTVGTPADSTDTTTTPMSTEPTGPMPTTINDAVEIITDVTTDGTNSALSVGSTGGNSSTNAGRTSLGGIARTTSSATSPASNDATSGSTDSPTTSPMTSATRVGTPLSTASTLRNSSTVQGDRNSTDVPSTVAMRGLFGPSTDPADTRMQSSTKLGTTNAVGNPTSPVSTISSTSVSTPVGNSVGTAANSSATSPAENSTTTPAAKTGTSPRPASVSVSTPMSAGNSDGTTANSSTSSKTEDSTTNPEANPTTSPVPTGPSVSTSTSVGNSDETTADSSTTDETENSTTNASEDTATNSVRRRRGLEHGPAGYFSSSAGGIWLEEFGRLNGHEDYPSQDDDIVVDSRRPTEVAFLVNGCDYSRVTAAVYTAVLPFAYFPSLRASMLEFPLDDPRYKILVTLPGDANGARRVAGLLASESITLRRLRRSLHADWITAVVPSFMLRGFVTLTPFLQRLGISDVFDPRAADLSTMSPDLGVYARDIQQSIGLNIRNNAKGGIGGADGGNEEEEEEEEEERQSRSADSARSPRGFAGLHPFFAADGEISPPTRGNPRYSPYPGAGNVLYGKAHPVPFVVDRSFLYFIVDDETSATLLAGRIDDPLNSRIL